MGQSKLQVQVTGPSPYRSKLQLTWMGHSLQVWTRRWQDQSRCGNQHHLWLGIVPIDHQHASIVGARLFVIDTVAARPAKQHAVEGTSNPGLDNTL
jgi:hypothetical protein